MPSFYALITTIDVPGSPPGWDTFPKPMPQPPLGIWGGPWQPPYPSQGPGFPTHPIAPGGPPLGTWGGVGQPYPDHGLPGPQPGGPPGIWGGPWQPPYPSQGPGFPTHPIVLPPPPGSGAPPIAAQLPVFPPEATHPIVLPPNVAPPTMPDGRRIEWKTGWSQATGWVIYGVPTGPAPTPSQAQQPTGNPQAPRPA